MTSTDPRLRFDVSAVLSAFVQRADSRPSALRLDLPFISVMVHPSQTDKRLGRELLVRLQDRRVLNARECCDGCINEALTSLQQIRAMLIDFQVQLANETSGVMSALIELMTSAIRQFLTFEQALGKDTPWREAAPDGRPWEIQQAYFEALENLRGHISRCLGLAALIAGVEAPSDGLLPNYRGPWPLNAYAHPIDLPPLPMS